MGWLKNLSYINKLTVYSMINTTLAIGVLVAAFIYYQIANTRTELVENLQESAQMLAFNTRTALQTNDLELLSDSINNLSRKNIVQIVIFSTKGETLAEYGDKQVRYENEAMYSRTSLPAVFSSNDVLITEPVFADNELLGSIALRSSLEKLKWLNRQATYLSLAAFFTSLLASFLVLRFTQGLWAAPFTRISNTIKDITQNRDYSKRLELTSSNDELGQLTNGFNTMLHEIEIQNEQLFKHQHELEEEVESRTAQLQKANENLLNVVAEKSVTEANLMKLSSAVTQAEEAVIITDKEGYIEYVNPSFEKVTGYSETHAMGKKPSLLRSDLHDEQFYSEVWDTLLKGEVYRGVFINARPNGDNYYLEQSITPIVTTENRISHFVATGRDISDRVQNEKDLQYMAHHDALTGLPNRSLLMDRINHSTDKAKRDHQQLAVMFIDLDGFKMTNDIFGHEAGDILLKSVASRLRSAIRSQDTVARISGDEFAVVLEDIQSLTDAGIVARKIMDSLCMPYMLGENEVLVTASIGISVYPDDATDTRLLIKHADMAMYTAKNAGKARYSFYSSEDNERDTNRMELEQQLLRAVKRQQFDLHYQPLIKTSDESLYGAEALLRWPQKGGEIYMPGTFIPRLEDSGMIEEVGAWVMEKACKQLAIWNDKLSSDLIMSINVSPRQLDDRNFTGYLKHALSSSGVNPRNVQLEITETIFLAFNEINVAALKQANKLGVRIAVDDFGMGHSSLVYLSKLSVDTLKIDQSFVQEINRNDDDEKIVSALIALGERLNLTVTAEGVETREQLSVLDNLNCEVAQGFLFARAMPNIEFENWYKRGLNG